ncbi:MAG: hypothetical protein PVJ61_01930 [Dehalococcoidia bacterium]
MYVDVEVSAFGDGEVEVAGRIATSYPVTRRFETGSHVSLVALPAEGYYFVGWSGDLCGNENPTEARVTSETEITALFFPSEVASADGGLRLEFAEGTAVQDAYGQPLLGLDVAAVGAPPPPPPASYVIGLPYELGPYGTSFGQPVALSLSYDPALLPERVPEEELNVGYYDEELAEWQLLPSAVDADTNTVTASIEHLSIFGVISPEPPPLPADFSAGGLTIYPDEVEIGELVVMSVMVVNSGEAEGNYAVRLTVNGEITNTKEVVMPGGSQQVVFSLTEGKAGDYAVEINGLESSFTVLKPSIFPIALPGAVSWVIVGLVIAALVVIAVIAPLFGMGRQDY